MLIGYMLPAHEQHFGKAGPILLDAFFHCRRELVRRKVFMHNPNIAVSDGIFAFGGIEWFAKRRIDVDGATGGLDGEVQRIVDHPVDRPYTVVVIIILWEGKILLHV